MNKYYYNKDFFNKIDTEEKAYWLGFLYADGCIVTRSKCKKITPMSLELGLSSIDNNHLYKFLNSLESNIEVKNKIVELNGKKYESSKITISCKKICEDLIKQGCVPKKSLILKFPTKDILPNELIRHFIRGYFDGDGCINKRKESNTMRIIFVGTLELLTSIEDIFIKNKILRTKPSITKKGNAYQLVIRGVDNIKDIYNYLYKDCNIYLDRKYDKFNNYLSDINKNRQNKDSNKRGVYFDKRTKKWIATIYINKKRIRLGSFKNIDDAIKIRKEYEIEKMIAENK